jgi:alkylation response protein AidB-like acyl-CoA dehydrogenase
MAIVDIEVGLGEQEKAVRDAARKFADEVMRPAGVALDRLPDPAQVIAPGSVLWQVFEKHRALGIGDLDLGGEELSPLERARLRFLVSEELGRGDSGLAISLGVAGFHRMFAHMSGRPALVERFCRPDSRDIGCWAVTEPDHGSDTLATTERAFADPAMRANCVARKDG